MFENMKKGFIRVNLHFDVGFRDFNPKDELHTRFIKKYFGFRGVFVKGATRDVTSWSEAYKMITKLKQGDVRAWFEPFGIFKEEYENAKKEGRLDELKASSIAIPDGYEGPYDVLIEDCDRENKKFLSALRKITGLKPSKLKSFLEILPNFVKENISKEEAEEIKKILEENGAKITLDAAFSLPPDPPAKTPICTPQDVKIAKDTLIFGLGWSCMRFASLGFEYEFNSKLLRCIELLLNRDFDKETAAKEYGKIKNEFDMITPGYSLEKFSKFFDWLSDYISIDLRVGEESAKKICGGIRLSPDYTEKTIEEETEKLKQNPYMDIIFKMLGNPEVFAIQNAEGLKKVLNDPNL